jgi:Ca2+-binding EF-hand superfamily protein
MKRLVVFLGLILLGIGLASPVGGQVAKAKADAPNDLQDFVLFSDARPILIRLHIRVGDQPFTVVWNAFMQHLFNYLDVNGDGHLDQDELDRVPSAELLLGRGLAGIHFHQVERLRPSVPLPRNKEGKVTVAELSAYYRGHGLAPFQLRIGATPKTMGPIISGVGYPPKDLEEPRSGIAVGRTMFSLLDTNRDGKLTAKELAAAPAALLKADRNDDDVLTLEEMEACALQEGAGREDPGRVLLIGPETPVAELVRRLKTCYGQGKTGLSAKDLGLDDKTFKLLDKDQNGKLDDDELGGFARRAPDLELTFRFSEKGNETNVELNSPPSSLAGTTHNKKGPVSIQLGTLAVQLRPGASMIRPQVTDEPSRSWANLDLDKKGFVTEAALSKAYPGTIPVGGKFKMMDRNSDGKVTQEEYLGYLHRLSDLQVRATASCVSLVFLDSGLGLFDLLDADGDGILTVQEMTQAPKLLERIDKSGKGYLTEQDLPRTWNLVVRRGPAVGRGFGAFANNGYEAGFVVKGGYAKYLEEGPSWFHRMDSNGDGYLSRREFLGTDEQFRQLDRDGDGRISIEEAIQADAVLRKKK